ncbi:MAG: hypothetical protein ACFFDW_06465 [Candidatus Thorarchaeota archaeon]
MVSWNDEFKQAGIELGYDLLLVALVICWVAALVTAILEVTLWIAFGLFFLGCVFLFSMFYVSRKYDEKEEEQAEEQPAN